MAMLRTSMRPAIRTSSLLPPDRHQSVVLEAAQALQFRLERLGEADAICGFEFVEAQFQIAHQLRDHIATQTVVRGEAHAARDREAGPHRLPRA